PAWSPGRTAAAPDRPAPPRLSSIIRNQFSPSLPASELIGNGSLSSSWPEGWGRPVPSGRRRTCPGRCPGSRPVRVGSGAESGVAWAPPAQAGALAAQGEGGVGGDPVQPGGQGRLAPECVEPARRPEQGVAGDVRGVGVVAQEAPRHRVHPRRVLPEQTTAGATAAGGFFPARG